MKAELQRLQGVWNIVALEVDGKSMPAGDGRVVVKNDRFTSLGMGAEYKGKIDLDTSQRPWTIDMKFTAGPEKGNLNRGIFEFQGDSWRLCLQMTGAERPKEFATKPGSGLALETLERATPGTKPDTSPAKTAKKAANSTPADFPTAPVPELEGEWAMTACSHSGEPLEAAHAKMGRRVARGNEVTVFMGKQVMFKARYAVNRSHQPNTIDYLLADGQTQLGIFKLQGDTLDVSFAGPGQPRPDNFDSRPGDGRSITSWKRAKK